MPAFPDNTPLMLQTKRERKTVIKSDNEDYTKNVSKKGTIMNGKKDVIWMGIKAGLHGQRGKGKWEAGWNYN